MDTPPEQHQTTNFDALIADLKAKRAVIDQAITSLEQLSSLGRMTLVQMPGGQDLPTGLAIDSSIRSDTFFNLTIVDAVKKYLNLSKQPRSLKDILTALDEGGFVHDSSNFYATVHSSLIRREKQIKDVVRVKRKWALASWYPSRRQAEPKD